MVNIAENLNIVKNNIDKICQDNDINSQNVNLIAVSKTFDVSKIQQAIKAGCHIFGENRVTEAENKWPELKSQYPYIELHLIGHLQSKKVKQAVKLFDVIETLDSEKLAAALADQMEKQKRYPQIFIQINIGEESQKSGINPQQADDFIKTVINKYKLPVTGLMCIPPQDEEPSPYFALLVKIAKNNNLKNISMGMSNDYKIAIALGANYIRIGTAIFGERTKN